MTKKIKNFKKRVESSLYDPLQKLAEEFYDEGYSEEDLVVNFKKIILPDYHRVKLHNYFRDAQRK